MKTSLLVALLVGTFAAPSLSQAEPALTAMRPELPVIIPDSSVKITKGWPGTYAHTYLRILDTTNATPANLTQVNTPATIRRAYNLPSNGGAGAIAIVDAYHYPTALNDFNTFAQTYGLPRETSATVTAATNTTFQLVYATGQKPASGGSYIAGWNMEEALDIEWAHAIAPGAKIYLVEAATNSTVDLLVAVRIASALPGVREVSMSWGGAENVQETTDDSAFTRPSVTYFASGGDVGDDLEYPSASPNVVSVGGTTMFHSTNGSLVSETAWSGTGCGISAYELRPSFQNVISDDVGNQRGANDVSFDADPNTGVQVYDTTPINGTTGWTTVGGTSLSAPCWAGVVNLASVANGVASSSQAENTRLYDNLGDATTFRDISTGEAGDAEAAEGWDQPTGIGTPLGLTGK